VGAELNTWYREPRTSSKKTRPLPAALQLPLWLDLSTFFIDVRFSARHFVRTPGVSLALFFTIALGIGSNVTVHGFVRGINGWFQYSAETPIVKPLRSHIKNFCRSEVISARSNGLVRREYLSDAVRQRRREFAVRIALGAQRRHVILQVLREGARLACTGAVAGTLGSLLLSRMLAGIIPGNGLPAFWVWMVAPLLLAASVVIASVLPARRASIVDPLTIMRDH
jgi:hypothetical protein